jgi:U3 small nucleolar RNA-associated protein 12
LSFDDPNYPYCPRGHVSTLARCDDKKSICVGYTTGEARIFNYITGSLTTTFRGHRSAVNCLAIDESLLATGGADCDIVIWDIVASLGIVRFREHKDAVTSLKFCEIEGRKMLLSVSKDTLFKVRNIKKNSSLIV